MDIQARKLDLIGEFLRISDESIIEKLESIISSERNSPNKDLIEPMSLNQFHEMIKQAIEDKENGNIISHEDLKKSIESW